MVNPKGRDVAEEPLITNAEPKRAISATLSWLAAAGRDEEQTDGLVASEAIRLLREHREEPFFLGVGFFRPHSPYVAPRKYFDLHPMDRITLPEAPPDDRGDIPVAAFAHNNPVPNYGLPIPRVLQAKQAYYACVSFVDAQIGRVLAALDELGLAGNTVVVFWSDHGYHLGEHQGIWQKRCLFEESATAPLIVRAPGMTGNGRTCRRVVEFVDLYPTVADLCGVTVPSSMPLTGRSLRPLLENPSADWDSAGITQVLRPADSRFPGQVMGRSVRTERWRYTEWNEGRDGLELYDHAADPHEFHNRAVQPDAEALAVMRQLRLKFTGKAGGGPPSSPVNPLRL